jgi:uncharacterized protein
MKIHHAHPEILKRLKRANGHLAKVISMIHDERSCLEVAQQLHAVEQAISNAKKVLIKDHIDHCLDDAVHNHEKNKTDLSEFKEITKYL